jgi:outer membrane usher protein
VEGHSDDFIVGYDGQAFVKRLSRSNTVTVDMGDAGCHARFAFTPQQGKQVKIGPVMCQ